MRPMKNFSNKNCLTTKKRGNFLPTTRRHRKLKEKESSETNEIFKNKKIHKSISSSNNKLLRFSKNIIFQNFDNTIKENKEDNNMEKNRHYNKVSKDNYNNLFNQFKGKGTKSNYIKLYSSRNSNSNKKDKGFTFSNKDKNDNDKSKKKFYHKNSKYNVDISYETDNEVENNILCLMGKSPKKRNSIINNNQKDLYFTQKLANDKIFTSLNNSLAGKKNKSNDFGIISNFSNISIIKKTELNHCDINNNDYSDFFQDNVKKKGPKFKGMANQKDLSNDYKDNDSEEQRNEDNINDNVKNKEEKKYIIYNNINYYKTTQKDNDDIIIKNKDSINNEEKDDNSIINKKISFNNNYNSHCGCSLFNCCFVVD